MRLRARGRQPAQDADKLRALAPVWAAFLAKFEGARDREAAWALRWSFRIARVDLRARLLPRRAVSLAKVSAAPWPRYG